MAIWDDAGEKNGVGSVIGRDAVVLNREPFLVWSPSDDGTLHVVKDGIAPGSLALQLAYDKMLVRVPEIRKQAPEVLVERRVRGFR